MESTWLESSNEAVISRIGKIAPASIIVLALISGFLLISWLRNRRRNSFLNQIPAVDLPLQGDFLYLRSNYDSKNMQNFTKHPKGIAVTKFMNQRVVLISKPKYLKILYKTRKTGQFDVSIPVVDLFEKSSKNNQTGSERKHERQQLFKNFFKVPEKHFLTVFKTFVRNKMMNRFYMRADQDDFPCFRILQETVSYALFDHAFDSAPASDFTTHVVNNMANLQKPIPVATGQHFFRHILRLTEEGSKIYETVENAREAAIKLVIKKRNHFREMKAKNRRIPDNIFIYKLIEKNQTKGDDYLANQVINLVFSCVGKTTRTLGFVLNMLGIHQDIQERIFLEGERRRQKGSEVTAEELLKEDFLHLVILETLRLFPMQPIIGRKLLEDTLFDNFMIPAGTNVMACTQCLHLNPEIFDFPTQFKPERFKPENLKKIPEFAFQPFGSGARCCPGMKYAILSIKTYVHAILREYKVFSVYKNTAEALAYSSIDSTAVDMKSFSIRLQSRGCRWS